MKNYLPLTLFIVVLFSSCKKQQDFRIYIRSVDMPNTASLGDTITINFKGYFPADCWEFDRFNSQESSYMLEIYPYMKKVSSYCPADSIPFEHSAKFFPEYEGDWTIVTYGADTTIVKYLNVHTGI